MIRKHLVVSSDLVHNHLLQAESRATMELLDLLVAQVQYVMERLEAVVARHLTVVLNSKSPTNYLSELLDFLSDMT